MINRNFLKICTDVSDKKLTKGSSKGVDNYMKRLSTDNVENPFSTNAADYDLEPVKESE